MGSSGYHLKLPEHLDEGVPSASEGVSIDLRRSISAVPLAVTGLTDDDLHVFDRARVATGREWEEYYSVERIGVQRAGLAMIRKHIEMGADPPNHI